MAMHLTTKPLSLHAPDGPLTLWRSRDGIPEIHAAGELGAAFGLGWSHGLDRQLQLLLTRIVLQGRAAELLSGDPLLLNSDRAMRRLNLLPDAAAQLRALEPFVRAQLEAYCAGLNLALEQCGTVWELRLLGVRPEPWSVGDCLRLGKAFGFIGLADSQGAMERLLLQMIQQGVGDAQLRELFPYLGDPVDRQLLGRVRLEPPFVPAGLGPSSGLPRARASNNWAVAAARSATGQALLCGDPHLEVNRLPAIFQEVLIHLPDNRLAGVSLPGIPGLLLGRTRHIAWSATYAFMDMLDLRIEHCRDGHYRRGRHWHRLRLREEQLGVKRGQPVTQRCFETDLGVVEGEPDRGEGYFLVACWSAARGCGAGDFNALLRLPAARSAEAAMALLRRIESSAFNYVIADRDGHIGYQMSGRCFRRPPGVSGLLPTPAWDPAYDPQGFVAPEELPALFDPPEGIIVTANQDLNHWGRGARPINLCMGAYRAERIAQMLTDGRRLDVEAMRQIQADLYSLQAERLMHVIRPLLPDTPAGRCLRNWDLTYRADSLGATRFEAVYAAWLRAVFGDGGLGRAAVDHLLNETSVITDYYANFDAILLQERSAWLGERSRGALLRQAIDEGLAAAAPPYGHTRQIMLQHLLFGGKLPRWLGFDRGPIALPGNRATVLQGQIFRVGGRTTTFSPAYRFIADLADGLTLHSNLPGGPSDRRFSPWFASELDNWRCGTYKTLR
jgi:penicillin amidase